MDGSEEHTNMVMVTAVLLVTLLGSAHGLVGQESHELNTVLMESTYKVQGPLRNDPRVQTVGTTFFLGRPRKAVPNRSFYVLITARHVLDSMGDDATIFLRQKQADGTFRRFPHQFKIRDKGVDLYVHHPEADVAAMYFSSPVEAPFLLVNMNVLADDERLAKLEIHPGDTLFCLGYPLAAEANDAGFPILRSGTIASYPLVPTKTVKSFLFDFHVFDGNSGGPVYFSYDVRYYGGQLKAGGMQSIVGLVTRQEYSAIPGHLGERLDLGVIVPATFIVETINLLPERDR